MKKILLNADNEISVFAVPDEVADHLTKYCNEFCCNWLPKSPDATKYHVNVNGMCVMCFDEKDFIDYLNQYICDEKSFLVETLTGVYYESDLPKEYIGLPYYGF